MKAFIPFIIIAICIGTYYMYISPTLLEVQALSAKKAEYTNALQKTKEVKELRDNVLASYNSISPENLARLSKIIPENFDAVLLATDINNTASQYGMTIREVKITTPHADVREAGNSPSDTAPYKTLVVAFSVKGQYEQFSQFLKDLESHLHLVDITNLSASVDTKNSNSSVFKYGVELHTYSLH